MCLASPNSSQTGRLYKSQKRTIPQSPLLLRLSQDMDMKTVTGSLHLATLLFQSYAHSQRQGSGGMVALFLPCNLGFLTLSSSSFPEHETLRGTMVLTRATLLLLCPCPPLPPYPSPCFNSSIFLSWGVILDGTVRYDSIVVSFDPMRSCHSLSLGQGY